MIRRFWSRGVGLLRGEGRVVCTKLSFVQARESRNRKAQKPSPHDPEFHCDCTQSKGLPKCARQAEAWKQLHNSSEHDESQPWCCGTGVGGSFQLLCHAGREQAGLWADELATFRVDFLGLGVRAPCSQTALSEMDLRSLGKYKLFLSRLGIGVWFGVVWGLLQTF